LAEVITGATLDQAIRDHGFMSTDLELLGNNPLAATLIAATIIGAAGWIWNSWRNRRDGDRIHQFLVDSANEYEFRSTPAIVSRPKIPKARVQVRCLRHPKIRRNENESWTLVTGCPMEERGTSTCARRRLRYLVALMVKPAEVRPRAPGLFRGVISCPVIIPELGLQGTLRQ
jgi:hypothetical protein